MPRFCFWERASERVLFVFWVLAEAGGIAPLVALARDGTKRQQENATAALQTLERG